MKQKPELTYCWGTGLKRRGYLSAESTIIYLTGLLLKIELHKIINDAFVLMYFTSNKSYVRLQLCNPLHPKSEWVCQKQKFRQLDMLNLECIS